MALKLNRQLIQRSGSLAADFGFGCRLRASAAYSVLSGIPRAWLLILLALVLFRPAATLAQPSLSIVRSADGTDLLVAQEGDPRAPGILMIHGFAQSYTFFEAPARFNTELAAFTVAARAPTRPGDPAASIPRPTIPMTAAAHRAFRDREFTARDTNGDGRLDAAELTAVAGHSLSPDELKRVMRLNCGTDGPVCPRALFRAQGDAEFRRVDRDGDGVVTADELKQAGGTFHVETP